MPGLELTDEDAWAYKRFRLMQLFRWPPAVVDALSAKDVRDIFAAMAAQVTHNEKVQWWP